MAQSKFLERRRSLAPVGLALLIALAWATPALAQGAGTGAMHARVLDPDGAALPGVMVFVEGPLGTNTQVTVIDGTARILGLAPGLYTATFSLDGFRTVVREELRITTGRSITVTVRLELSSVEETITVTGESPVVDVRSAKVGSLYTDDLIDMAPTASGIWAGVLDHVPGVVTSRIDIGGGESGQQSLWRAFGGAQNQYSINGLPNIDPVRATTPMFAYVSIGSFEEIAIETAAHDVEMQSPGVMLNMVVKSGSNDFHGAAKIFYNNDSMVSGNIDGELEEAGVTGRTANILLRDVDLQAGGPIWKDRAWLFVDYWNFHTDRLVIGVPVTDPDDFQLTDWTLNSTVQLDDNHKVSFRYLRNRKFRANRGARSSRPPEYAVNQDGGVDGPQLEWQAVWGRNTFSTIRFAKIHAGVPYRARNPNDDPAGVPGRSAARAPHHKFLDIPSTDDWDDTGLLYPDNPDVTRIGWPGESNFIIDRVDLNGSLSHYIAADRHSHDLKLGAEYGDFSEFNPRNIAFGLGQKYDTIGGVPLTPAYVDLWNVNPIDMLAVEEPNGETNKGRQYSLYAQDAWTIRNRVTVTAGVRWDWSKSWYPDQVRQVSYWPQLGEEFQEAIIPALDPVAVWSDVVPRIGIIYDLRGDGRTALKANYARYSEFQGTSWAGLRNPTRAGFHQYDWSDANGDGMFQFGEQAGLIFAFFPGLNVDYDETLESPVTDEATAGVEHELMDNFLVSGRFIWRDRKNNVGTINIGEPYGPIAATLGVPDRWIPFEAQDPGPDGIYGTADDGGPITIFGITRPLNDQYLITNPEKFGFDQEFGYKGLELAVQKRWSDNWQLLASYNYGKATSFGRGAGLDPNSDINRNGERDRFDRPHMIRLTGNYLFAEPIGVNVGVFLRLNSGQGRFRDYRFRRSDWPQLTQGNQRIRVAVVREDAIGPRAYPWVKILDVRVEKQFTIGKYGVLHAYLDVFNALNTNAVTSASARSGPNFDRIRDIISPRVIRIGAAWDF